MHDIYVITLVTPEVEIVLSHTGSTGITIGTIIMMHCNVSRTNPNITAYRWIKEDMNTSLGSTNILTLILSRVQDFGRYRCEATNAANLTGSGNVTIEQGCKLISIYHQTCAKVANV